MCSVILRNCEAVINFDLWRMHRVGSWGNHLHILSLIYMVYMWVGNWPALGLGKTKRSERNNPDFNNYTIICNRIATAYLLELVWLSTLMQDGSLLTCSNMPYWARFHGRILATESYWKSHPTLILFTLTSLDYSVGTDEFFQLMTVHSNSGWASSRVGPLAKTIFQVEAPHHHLHPLVRTEWVTELVTRFVDVSQLWPLYTPLGSALFTIHGCVSTLLRGNRWAESFTRSCT